MARRNVKRDRKGRFAKVAGMKGTSPRSVRPSGANKTKPVKVKRDPYAKFSDRTKKNLKRAQIAYGTARLVTGVAAGYAIYEGVTYDARRAKSQDNLRNVANSMSRGLPQIKVPKRSRRGVYNITTL